MQRRSLHAKSAGPSKEKSRPRVESRKKGPQNRSQAPSYPIRLGLVDFFAANHFLAPFVGSPRATRMASARCASYAGTHSMKLLKA
jgi:hypothetical protein